MTLKSPPPLREKDERRRSKHVSSDSRILDEVEYFFACPHCWQQVSVVLDISVSGQTYIEDCEVCCHPIEVHYTVEDEAVCDFEARPVE